MTGTPTRRDSGTATAARVLTLLVALCHLTWLDGLGATRVEVIREAPHTLMPTHPGQLAAAILATVADATR